MLSSAKGWKQITAQAQHQTSPQLLNLLRRITKKCPKRDMGSPTPSSTQGSRETLKLPALMRGPVPAPPHSCTIARDCVICCWAPGQEWELICASHGTSLLPEQQSAFYGRKSPDFPQISEVEMGSMCAVQLLLVSIWCPVGFWTFCV